ncbi:hypothetical protein NDU88_003549 [Pleurodeles waltl]|uniref:Uncharacterized protein n=1 Tax=Pleurodeles waltl TaxID=8319 RepID=A0AAV7VFP0_PLEWA|nr:hypothetical protein NDU88_003549 [Pleurodeles waltl]
MRHLALRHACWGAARGGGRELRKAGALEPRRPGDWGQHFGMGMTLPSRRGGNENCRESREELGAVKEKDEKRLCLSLPVGASLLPRACLSPTLLAAKEGGQ